MVKAKNLQKNEAKRMLQKIGESLKREREKRGMSRIQLGCPLDITVDSIWRYEKGRDMRLSRFLKLLHAMDSPPDKFFESLNKK